MSRGKVFVYGQLKVEEKESRKDIHKKGSTKS